MLNVKIKKLVPSAVTPTYAKLGDAGMDITAVSKSYDDHGNVAYGTGLAFEVPEGFVGLLFPRSSNTKKDLILGNSVGVLDSGYRGEVVFKFKQHQNAFYNQNDDLELPVVDSYNIGDRIGQIIIIPRPLVCFEEVEELSSTDRGEGGFGSTGE